MWFADASKKYYFSKLAFGSNIVSKKFKCVTKVVFLAIDEAEATTTHDDDDLIPESDKIFNKDVKRYAKIIHQNFSFIKIYYDEYSYSSSDDDQCSTSFVDPTGGGPHEAVPSSSSIEKVVVVVVDFFY